MDIISCFPYEALLANDDEGRLPKLLRVLKLSKLFRLLRLVRIVRILRVLQRLEYSLHMQEGKARICTSPTCYPANQPLGRPTIIAVRTLLAARCLPHLAAPVSSKLRTPLTTHAHRSPPIRLPLVVGVRQLASFVGILIITTHWFSCLFYSLGDFHRMEVSRQGESSSDYVLVQ